MSRDGSPLLTRGQFLKAAGTAAGALALDGRSVARGAAPSAPSAAVQSFRSRPDLRPPTTTVTLIGSESALASGYSFLAPSRSHGAQAGPLIVDASGQAVWFQPLPASQLASCFRVQTYRGQPVLTWWQGRTLSTGYGQGEGVILDSSYREVARVRAANGRSADLHEFILTPEGTALITCYPETVPANLLAVDGPRAGYVYESIIQEIDVSTGGLVMEWRALEHVGLAESHASPWDGFDYLHANSVAVMQDGNLLVSCRHTWALYKLARHTGKVIWRLGGKRSDFAMGRAARFAWQHDARQVSATEITVFDDGDGPQKTESQSRGLVLTVDLKHRTVHAARSYRHDKPLLAMAMGSTQVLGNGNAAVGWGNLPWLSEFGPEGTLIADLRLPWGCASYRGLRFPWSGTPSGAPALAVAHSAGGASTLYASWNGATEVSAWQVSVGQSPTQLRPVTVAQRTGFETAIPVGTAAGYCTVTAVDATGRPLASSKPIEI